MSGTDRKRLFPHLELVRLESGAVLCESDAELRHAYFPISSLISLIYVTGDGSSTEVAVTGCEGMIGIPLFMGGKTTPNRAVVTGGGYAYRLTGALTRQEFDRSLAVQQILLRYTQALLTQMSLIAVCNRHHSVDQQLCRWLLTSLDRLPSRSISTTHELISNMLGVRREGVTLAAGKLQAAGIIACTRGHITMLDRPRLEQLSCECYRTVHDEFDRLLPNADPMRAAPEQAQAAAASVAGHIHRHAPALRVQASSFRREHRH